MQTEFLLKPNVILTGERDYETTLGYLLGLAQREILIFDQHLRTGNYQSLAIAASFQHFLNLSPQNRLQIILHEADFLRENCPKLMHLLKIYGHQMQILLTNDHAKIAKDCLLIIDAKHTLRRIHIDHARFKYTLDDAETAAQLRGRFDEIAAETTAAISATHLGL